MMACNNNNMCNLLGVVIISTLEFLAIIPCVNPSLHLLWVTCMYICMILLLHAVISCPATCMVPFFLGFLALPFPHLK